MQQQASLKKQKLHETTLATTLPELPAEVWAMIVWHLTRGGNPWLANRLVPLCLISKTHLATPQAALLFSKIRDRFEDLEEWWQQVPGTFEHFFKRSQDGRYRARCTYAEVVRPECHQMLWYLSEAMMRCSNVMGTPIGWDPPDGGRHVDTYSVLKNFWTEYKDRHHPICSLVIRSYLSKKCTPRICVMLNLQLGAIRWLGATRYNKYARQRRIAIIAQWFSWTMASFGAYMALDLKLRVKWDSDKFSSFTAWDAWDQRRLNPIFLSQTRRLGMPPPNSLNFTATLKVREDTSPDFQGIITSLPATFGPNT